jgi:hypothetical protein
MGGYLRHGRLSPKLLFPPPLWDFRGKPPMPPMPPIASILSFSFSKIIINNNK